MFYENNRNSSMVLQIAQILGFLGLLIIVGYVLVATQNLTVFSLMIMMAFALAIPIYSNINRINSWRAYQLNAIAPIAGLYVSLLFWVNTIGIDFSNPYIILVNSALAIISLCIALPIHYYTRELSVIKGRIEKDEFVHNSGNIIAVIVLGAFIAFNISETSVLDIRNISLVSLILGLYAFSSSFSVNSAYRRYKLNLNLETKDVSNKIRTLKERLVKSFPKKTNEIDFLLYLLNRMTSSFISGDFERCFIDAATIICDETVVKPKKYLEKILENEQWEKFRKIRVALVHSMIYKKNSKGEKTQEIMSKKKHLEIKSDLYQNCVDIQKTVFEVVSSFCEKEEEKRINES